MDHWLINVIVKQIQRLNIVSASAAYSDIITNRQDELGDLGRALSVMTSELTQANERLEQRVEERTEALNKEIGKHKTTNARLLEQEIRMQAIMDNVLDGIMTIDTDGYIQFGNPAARRMFGYSISEMEGRHISSIFGQTNKEYEFLNHFATRDNYAGELIEVSAFNKRGKRFLLEIAASKVSLAGKTLYIWMTRDITKR